MKIIRRGVDIMFSGLRELPDLSGVIIDDDYNISGNRLRSLHGCPDVVGGTFICSYNELNTLKYAPKEVSGDFLCWGNPGKFTAEDVRKVCRVRGRICTAVAEYMQLP